jgi:hypothetical protein
MPDNSDDPSLSSKDDINLPLASFPSPNSSPNIGLSVGDVNPAYDVVAQAEWHYRALLASGSASVFELTAAKLLWAYAMLGGKLPEDVTPNLRTARDIQLSEIKTGIPGLVGPDEYMKKLLLRIRSEAFYELIKPQLHKQKLAEYKQLGQQISMNPSIIRDSMPKESRGPFPWVTESNAMAQTALQWYSSQLEDWSRMQSVTPEWLNKSAKSSLWDFHTQRPIPLYLLRVSQHLPWDTETNLNDILSQNQSTSATDPPNAAEASLINRPPAPFREITHQDGDRIDVDWNDPQDLSLVLRQAQGGDFAIDDMFKDSINEALGQMTLDIAQDQAALKRHQEQVEMDVEFLTTLVGFIPYVGEALDLMQLVRGEDLLSVLLA